MLQRLQSVIKTRVILVFTLTHLGLALSGYALVKNDPTSSLYIAGVGCLYGGFLLSLFFIITPILPWIRRVQRIEFWISLIIENLPKIIAAYQQIIEIWNTSQKKETQNKSEKHVKKSHS